MNALLLEPAPREHTRMREDEQDQRMLGEMRSDIRHLQSDVTDIKTEMRTGFDRIEKRFEKVDARFDQIDQRLGKVDARFEQIEQSFEKVDARIDQIEQRFEKIDAQIEQSEQ